MNTNEIRWHLHNFKKIEKDIQDIKDDLREYRLMDGLKATAITDMPITHSVSSIVENIICREDYITKQKHELDMLMRVQRAINSIINRMTDIEMEIVERRYFITPIENGIPKRKYNWPEIARALNYTERQCMRIDRNIVLKIMNKLLGQ